MAQRINMGYAIVLLNASFHTYSVFWETQTKKIIIVNRLSLGYALPSPIVKA